MIGVYAVRCGAAVYVGASLQVESRVYDHKRRLKHDKHWNLGLIAAFQDGKEIESEILELAPDQERPYGEKREAVRAWLRERESHYIATIGTVNKRK